MSVDVSEYTIDEQTEYYNKRWSDEESRPIYNLELQRFIAIFDEVSKVYREKDCRVLDLGSGRGWLTNSLALLGEAVGLELSTEAVKAATKKYPNIKFYSGDLFELTEKLGKFDIIVSQEVLEHVEDQELFMNQVADALKPGGHFIFTTPNKWTQDHRTQEEHEGWGLQPIENWLYKSEINQLIKGKFSLINSTSIIAGFGTMGVFRVINSYKIRKLLDFLGLYSCYQNMTLKFNCGLHLIFHVKKL